MRRQKGYVLLELVATLVLVGLLAAMVVPFVHTGVTKASNPLTEMPTPLSVQSIMAQIIADYSSNATYLHDPSQMAANLTNGHYGITSSVTVVKDATYKFNAADLDTAYKVTLTDNATGETVIYVFTKQL